MRTIVEIAKHVDDLLDGLNDRHSVELTNGAVADFLEVMVQERLAKMLEESFSKYSITEIIIAIEVLQDRAAQQKASVPEFAPEKEISTKKRKKDLN